MRTYLPDQKNIKWELTFANALCGRNQKLVEEKVYGNIKYQYQIQNRRESEKEENELLVGLCFHEDEKQKKTKKDKDKDKRCND